MLITTRRTVPCKTAFPAVGDYAGAAAVPVSPFPAVLSPLRILVAEDNAINQIVAVHKLSKAGHSVVVAENGRLALDQLQLGRFDLLFLDVQMPEMDGLEVARTIRAQETATGDHLPIIAMTANTMEENRRRCLEAGMDGYVSKPLQTEDLQRAMRDALEPAESDGPAAPDPETHVFDEEAALARVDRDGEFLRTLAGMFLEQCPNWFDDIAAGLARSDRQAVQRNAHTLKGAAFHFCAAGTTGAAERLETAAAGEDAAGTAEMFQELRREVERLTRRLQALAPDLGRARMAVAGD